MVIKMKLFFKFKAKYNIPHEKVISLLTEAGINKIDYIIPIKGNNFNNVFKVRADNSLYILKIQKDLNKLLTIEQNRMLNDIEAYNIINHDTDNRVPTIVYHNTDYKEKDLPKPEYIFCLYKYVLATPYKNLHPNNKDKKMLYLFSGEVIGDFTQIKGKHYGNQIIGYESNWFDAFSKMVNALHDDEIKYFKKASKEILFLKSIIEVNRGVFSKIEPHFVHGSIDSSNLYFLNRKEDLIVFNPGEYFYGDILFDLTNIQPLVKLQNKVALLKGFEKTTKIKINPNDNDTLLRYYIMLLYKGLIIRDKNRLRGKWYSPNKRAIKTYSKAIITFATFEINKRATTIIEKDL